MSNFNTAALCSCSFSTALLALEEAIEVPFCAYQQDLIQSYYLSMSSACWSPADLCFGEDVCSLNETPEYEETPEEQLEYEWCAWASKRTTVTAQAGDTKLSCEFLTFWNIVNGHIYKDSWGWCVWLEANDGFYSPTELVIEYIECTGADVVQEACWDAVPKALVKTMHEFITQAGNNCKWFGPWGGFMRNPNLCPESENLMHLMVYEGKVSGMGLYENCL
jgi:hypothetical protein